MDLQVKETGNGGDIEFKGKDFRLVYGYENMPYLAMFGATENWWGNDLIDEEGTNRKIFSETEQVLNTVALNSAGRLKIEQAMLKDLEFIKANVPETDIKVQATIVSDDRVDLNVWINGELFNMQWNPDAPPMSGGAIDNIVITANYWWKAEDIVPVAGFLSSWTDTIANVGLKPNDGTELPLVQSAGLNGYDTVKFDDTPDQNIYSNVGIKLGSNKATVIVVMKDESTDPDHPILSLSESNTPFTDYADTLGVSEHAGSLRARMPDGAGQDKRRATPIDSLWHVYEFGYDRTSFPTVYIDGTATGTTGGTATLTGNFGEHPLFLGGVGVQLKTQIAEILIYNYLISASERATITAYLQNKYGL